MRISQPGWAGNCGPALPGLPASSYSFFPPWQTPCFPVLSGAAGVPGPAENSLRDDSKGRHRPSWHLHDGWVLRQGLRILDNSCLFLMLSLSCCVTSGKQLTPFWTPVFPSTQRHRSHRDGVECLGLVHGVLFSMVLVLGSHSPLRASNLDSFWGLSSGLGESREGRECCVISRAGAGRTAVGHSALSVVLPLWPAGV